ncbi:MAG: Holliday junction branch migration protein RuvA [Bacteroidaceae bacterium]|nr:Holliday junction branch migration protein RuvA [Bacteroidaceae bacterium]
MIEYIKGELTELTPATAVVECAGVGYMLNISLNAYSAIQGKKEIKLYVYEAISEDAHILYGFADKHERELFMQLLSVSGVGGGTARVIISSFTPAELCTVISTGNERLLKSVKGIGLKTAQRIIVDLKDKIGGISGSYSPTGVGGVSQSATAVPSAEVFDEAVSALTMLGFQSAASQKVVSAILKENPSLTVEQVIKEGLKRL